MNPTISIITVAFNAEKTIEATIESVSSQTLQDVEYVVIDGKSTDKTVEVIEKYHSKISKWISEPDAGIYDAMNKGLKLAAGKYVLFLNADDQFYDENVLTDIFSGANNEDIFYGETELIDENGKNLGDRWHKPPKRLNWKSLRHGMCVSHQSFIVKKEITPLYDLKYSLTADYDWVVKCLKAAKSIKNTEIYISKFMNTGVSNQHRLKSLSQRFKIMVKHYGFFDTVFNHFLMGINQIYFRIAKKEIF